ncbi:MAG TPA: HlyD family efflux transporter periplasmic adaptor subunit [Vicinamibacterales bacterium]
MKRRWWLTGLVLSVLALAGGVGVRQLRLTADEVPTVKVTRGDLDLSVHCTGELRPGRSAMVVAPAVAGTLQIVRLVPSGSAVKAGDVLVEFDPSEQEFNQDQSRSELEQAEQELVRLRAEAAVQAAQDRVAALKARFAVRRAELDLGARDLLGAIELRKDELTLEEARRRLAQLEQDVQSKTSSSRAAAAVLEAKRDKARVSMGQARQNIENMTLRAPLDGVVVLRQNMDASGGMFYSGMSLPEYRAGDMVWSGRSIADVHDTGTLELQTKINEADRANLSPGQKAEVRVDGLPGGTFPATIRTISGMAVRGFFFDNDVRRKFDATLVLTGRDPRLRPGLSAEIVISGQQLKGALYVPRQALYEKGGKPVVYARGAHGFEPRTVKIAFRTESRAVVEGLAQGTEVALIDPEARAKTAGKAAAAPVPAAQGGRR